jgi:nucleoid-associated protein YgaU
MTDIALRGPAYEKPAQVPEAWADPEHAFLEIFEPKHVKGGIPDLGASKGHIAFQFNPKEVSITKSAKWERKPSKKGKAGPPEYSGAEPCKLTLELFFDATMNQPVDVVKSVDKLFACCVPYKKFQKAEDAMPNLVIFNWGKVRSFAAYVSQVQAKYTRFAANGIPIRAVCTVNLEEIDVDNYPKQNPTSGSESVDNVHTMVACDRLPLIAYEEYGDPQLWRALADYNGIDDPLRIPNGTQLLLPRVDVLLTPIG